MTDKPWLNESEGPIFFEAHGLLCAMVRTIYGAWKGYVAIPPAKPFTKAHPLFRKDRYKIMSAGVERHGGVTYAAFGLSPIGHAETRYEMFDTSWVIGFHAGHQGDVQPQLQHTFGGVYRTEEYIRYNVCYLAAQVASMFPEDFKRA